MSWSIIQQSAISETQYTIAAYDGLPTGANALGPSVTTGITGATATTTVAGLSQSSTSGVGVGGVFTLVTSLTGAINLGAGTVTATSSGSGYVVNDTITFTQADLITAGLGAGTSGPLIITLDAGDIGLTAVQTLPTTSPPTVGATTVGFNTEGYGQGVTICYQVFAGTGVEVVLDINNDPAVADVLWVETDATHTSGTGSFFVASKNAYRQVRLRVKSITTGFSIISIKLMADS